VARVREQAETAEAICSALHRLSFEFIGETEDKVSTYFRRGTKPKHMRIEVLRSSLAPMVIVNVDFYNLSSGEPKFGHITQQVDVRGSKTDVMAATEKSVLRCLEIFKDILDGTGVAGPAVLAGTTGTTNDAPETDDEADEEGL
jgi:hypothetical protein